nr:hypothetical protein [uncultured bacterium]
MYKLVFLLLMLTNLTSFAQNNETFESMEQSFNDLSIDHFTYKVSYIEEKKTLYFEVKENGITINTYKLLKRDIHPKGIFLIENDNRYSIRILSLNNGHVFIKENFGTKYRHSNTTNFVDIGSWDKKHKTNLTKFLSDFEQFLNDKVSSETEEDDEIIIITNEKN